MTVIESSDGIPDRPDSTSQWIACPVQGCTVAWDVTPPQVDPGALAAVFGFGTLASTSHHEHHQLVEKMMHNHLIGHNVVEWATTVQAKNDEIRLLRQIRGYDAEQL